MIFLLVPFTVALIIANPNSSMVQANMQHAFANHAGGAGDNDFHTRQSWGDNLESQWSREGFIQWE